MEHILQALVGGIIGVALSVAIFTFNEFLSFKRFVMKELNDIYRVLKITGMTIEQMERRGDKCRLPMN